MISAPWRRPNLGALTSSSPTHNTSTSSPHTRPDAAATCEEFAAKAPESSNRQNRQHVRVTGERLSAEETNRGSSTKHRNNHNTWDSELVHLGCPWHSFSYPDPKRKKNEPTKNQPGYQRPSVAEASSLFHPDLVLVFPYAIRKCKPTPVPTVAMHA